MYVVGCIFVSKYRQCCHAASHVCCRCTLYQIASQEWTIDIPPSVCAYISIGQAASGKLFQLQTNSLSCCTCQNHIVRLLRQSPPHKDNVSLNQRLFWSRDEETDEDIGQMALVPQIQGQTLRSFRRRSMSVTVITLRIFITRTNSFYKSLRATELKSYMLSSLLPRWNVAYSLTSKKK